MMLGWKVVAGVVLVVVAVVLGAAAAEVMEGMS